MIISCQRIPEEFGDKPAAESQPGLATIFRVLVCAEDETVACFDETVVSDPEGAAWLVRVLHASTVDTDVVEKMRSDMNPDKFSNQGARYHSLHAWAVRGRAR